MGSGRLVGRAFGYQAKGRDIESQLCCLDTVASLSKDFEYMVSYVILK